MGEQCLARLAGITGNTAMAARRRKRIEKGIAAMRQYIWDDKAGLMLDDLTCKHRLSLRASPESSNLQNQPREGL